MHVSLLMSEIKAQLHGIHDPSNYMTLMTVLNASFKSCFFVACTLHFESKKNANCHSFTTLTEYWPIFKINLKQNYHISLSHHTTLSNTKAQKHH